MPRSHSIPQIHSKQVVLRSPAQPGAAQLGAAQPGAAQPGKAQPKGQRAIIVWGLSAGNGAHPRGARSRERRAAEIGKQPRAARSLERHAAENQPMRAAPTSFRCDKKVGGGEGRGEPGRAECPCEGEETRAGGARDGVDGRGRAGPAGEQRETGCAGA